ncbi:hypothetical protein NC652_023050 [Populus alba x Populus x berolinensis]|nr:hypothetical protein NC652_023050 [Populus alba x Populus x berolinensis]
MRFTSLEESGLKRSDFFAYGIGRCNEPKRKTDLFDIFLLTVHLEKKMFRVILVKLILAKGNPHFVCDSRVLVKPYKEKGKSPGQHQQQQQIEREEYSACPSHLGSNCREPFDLHLGGRMFYNTQEMLRRKLEEEADLQQAIDSKREGY